MRGLLVTTALILCQTALASSFSGGVAKAEKNGSLSLLKFERSRATQNSEQLDFVLGDKSGAELSQPGYYHVAVDEGGTRLVIDLAQVQQTSVDEADLKNILKTSSLVRSAEITMDPVDKSTNITFLLKHPVTAKAVPTDGGKVSIRIQETR